MTTATREELAEELREGMAYASGSDEWFRHGLNRNVLYTQGVKFVAEKAGAYWLIDAIASHYSPRLLRHIQQVGIHFWTLNVDHSGKPKATLRSPMAKLECREDSGLPAIVLQRIAYTDFPLDKIKVYAQLGPNGACLMLPSEY